MKSNALFITAGAFFSVENTMRWQIHHQGSRAGAGEGLEAEITLL